jgi:hypothetical protein
MRGAAALVSAVLLLTACSGDDGGTLAPSTTTGPATSAGAPTATTPTTAAPVPLHHEVLEALAADELEGRDNGTPGGEAARAVLVEHLEAIAEPLGDGYEHPFAAGVNLLAVIPGTDLAEEHLVLGAHYDGLGRRCRGAGPTDDICNGAADNAAGVAAVLEIGRRIAAGEPPRRSVVLALWDAEEDGLLGAADYVGDPPVPLESTVAYLNWDIQGVNLLPSLRGTTVVVGAETGGPSLQGATRAAAAAGDLDPLPLSLLFGQGRSDHAPFAAAGVPVAFFTDANSGCYHTVDDELATVDLGKLDEQVDVGEALVRELASTDETPAFVPDLPIATFDDARSMLTVVERAQPDLGRFPPAARTMAEQFLADLRAMVEAGPAAFGDEQVATLLAGSAAVVALLADGECDGFLDG